MTTAAKPIPHGTLTGHKHHGCPCAPCREAAAAYQRSRHRRIGYGTWQPFVDATPAREHILTLMEAGIGYRRITQLAQVAPSVIEHLLYEMPGRPRTTRIRPETEAKILAVSAIPADQAHTDATGTRRRLQALVAAGWPTTRLAPEIGLNRRWVSDLLRATRVEVRTARLVAETYERLAHEDPTEHGIQDWVALRARNMAAKHGWKPPQEWVDDDLDVPDAEPDPEAVDDTAVQRAIDGEKAIGLSRVERMEAARVLTEQGVIAKDIAARLGVTSRTIVRWRAAGGWKAVA